MLNIINDNSKKVSILDFGCGCGHLLDYINEKKLNIESGLDIFIKIL